MGLSRTTSFRVLFITQALFCFCIFVVSHSRSDSRAFVSVRYIDLRVVTNFSTARYPAIICQLTLILIYVIASPPNPPIKL